MTLSLRFKKWCRNLSISVLLAISSYDGYSQVRFTENRGQISDQFGNPRTDILYNGKTGQNMNFYLKSNGLSYQINQLEKKSAITRPSGTDYVDSLPCISYRIDIQWLNANLNPRISAVSPAKDYNNYYLTHCPSGVTHIKSYRQVTYYEVHKGIDLKWYESNGNLEYDYVIAPGADPNLIKWKVSGAKSISINNQGDLLIETSMGIIKEAAPVAFQDKNLIEANWLVQDSVVGFSLGSYDSEKQLTIDPVIRFWGTYYGGSGAEYSRESCLDNEGNSYIAGMTWSLDNIATVGAHQTIHGGSLQDAFLVKFDKDGNRIWGTYYGGNSTDQGLGCATTGSHVYLVGNTANSSPAIPTAGAHQFFSGGGGLDGFLVKFDSSGVRVWGTYYGGSQEDNIRSCSVYDNVIYISGITQSSNGISTLGSYQPTFGGGSEDAYLAKFTESGVRIWGTYFGGSGNDEGRYCHTNGSFVFLSGETSSSNAIATSGAHQAAHGGGLYDAYLAKFDSTGAISWSTFYGGNDYDEAYACMADSTSVYLTGTTESTNGIASAGSYQTALGGGVSDAFLARFDMNGNRKWGTYSGGLGPDDGFGCFTTGENIFITGYTKSLTTIATTGSYQPVYGGDYSDGYLIKFDSAGSKVWGTYYGGSFFDQTHSVKVRGTEIYLMGYSGSEDGIASTAAYADTLNGFSDAFLVRLSDCTINYDTAHVTACDSFYWTGANLTYNASGIHSTSLTNIQGCDSFATLNLEVKLSSFGGEAQTSCGSFTWPANFTTYSSTGIYQTILTNSAGCDSIVSLDLTIHNSNSSSVNDTACFEYTSVTGLTYDQSGSYVDTLSTEFGCDSLVTLNLTLYKPVSSLVVDFHQGVHTLISEDTNYTEYAWFNCSTDSIIGGALSYAYIPSNADEYALIVMQEDCEDTSSCVSVPLGVEQMNYSESFRISPNPSDGIVKVNSEYGNKIKSIQGFNDLGQVVVSYENVNASEFEFSVENAAGTYYLRIEDQSGKIQEVKWIKR